MEIGRYPQRQGSKGSLRWIQEMVNQHPHVLDRAIGLGQIRWLSPLQRYDYAEYRDQEFLTRLGVDPTKRTLSSFWPAKGPQWDALGKAASGEAVLVEAKAHVSEMLSPPTKATGRSAKLIDQSLAEVSLALRATPGTDWSKRFYQYANRLAHAWFLQEANDIPVRLAFVNFIGDAQMNGPENRREWEAALTVLHEALGLRGRMPSYVTDVFIDIRPPVPSVV